MQWSKHEELDWGHRGKLAEEPVSFQSKFRGLGEGDLFCDAKELGQGHPVTSWHGQRPLQQNTGQRGAVVPWASSDSFTHHPLSYEIIEQVLLQMSWTWNVKTLAEGNIKVGKILLSLSYPLASFWVACGG